MCLETWESLPEIASKRDIHGCAFILGLRHFKRLYILARSISGHFGNLFDYAAKLPCRHVGFLRTITLLHRLFLMLFCSAALLGAAAQAKTLNVGLLLSDSSPPYRQFADSFSRNLVANQADVNIIESTAISGIQTDLIVAVGMQAAAQAIAQVRTPVLVAMIPDEGYRELLAQIYPPSTKLKISAIYLNQPLERRLDFIRAALPKQRRVGLLYSADNHIDIEYLRKEIEKRGASLVAQPLQAKDRLFSFLDRVLADSDVLLGIPDSAIYSVTNFRNILLTSYRHNVPVVGISKAYVNAGALCAIYSTPEQLAAQTARTVVSFSINRQLSAPQYPAEFSIEVNAQVARAMGIALVSQEAIRSQMNQSKIDTTGGLKQ